jgi:dihydroorotate dehydrogenase electron transfer subunit
MPHDIVTPVTRNTDLGHGNHLIEFRAPAIVREMHAAQFFMIGIPGAETLLRRPFSVCGLPGTFDGAPDGTAHVLYKVLGKATALMAALGPGAPLAVLGPLGRGFTAPEPEDGLQPVFVAGGVGSAPFPALTAELERRGGSRPILFYGGRSSADLPLLDWFRERCAQVLATTEDGSLGRQGLVTEPLAEWIAAAERPPRVLIQACGPTPMLREVARLALRHGVPCELSLEAHMACGFGVCLGCVVPVRTSGRGLDYERVCVEGPVMRAERLAW